MGKGFCNREGRRGVTCSHNPPNKEEGAPGEEKRRTISCDLWEEEGRKRDL